MQQETTHGGGCDSQNETCKAPVRSPPQYINIQFYRATLCISAVLAVVVYPSVRPSVTLAFCIETA